MKTSLIPIGIRKNQKGTFDVVEKIHDHDFWNTRQRFISAWKKIKTFKNRDSAKAFGMSLINAGTHVDWNKVAK